MIDEDGREYDYHVLGKTTLPVGLTVETNDMELNHAYTLMAVAIQGGARWDWACYVGLTPGINHDEEWGAAIKTGSKLEYRLSKIIFPDFYQKYKWRD